MLSWQKNLNLSAILILVSVLLSASGVQFFLKADPCPLCLLQRLCMIGVASSLLLNFIFGIRMVHYGMALFFCLVGATIALRQMALHIHPADVEHKISILGFSLYTWSFLIFSCTILGIAVLLCLHRPEHSLSENKRFNIVDKASACLLLLMVLTNTVVTFIQCGLTFCHH